MNVFIRTDASVVIGSGHVMRCLTLAETLREAGATVVFLCRDLPGNLIGHIEEKGFFVLRLTAPKNVVSDLDGTKHAQWLGVPWQADAKEVLVFLNSQTRPDWIVVDHYALDYGWETQIRPFVGNIMVIDDLADRCHECDLLLDQNLYDQMETRYEGLLPEKCVVLLGPKYALLRPEFLEARKNLTKREGSLRGILIFFGGSDNTNETAKALEALMSLNLHGVSLDVVVGDGNPHKDRIKQACSVLPHTSYYCQVTTMANLMLSADLAIGAGGSTTWERCAVGLPTIAISVADNQVPIAETAVKAGVLFYLGASQCVTVECLRTSILYALKNPGVLKKMSEKAFKLVDGEGATRVADYLV